MRAGKRLKGAPTDVFREASPAQQYTARSENGSFYTGGLGLCLELCVAQRAAHPDSLCRRRSEGVCIMGTRRNRDLSWRPFPAAAVSALDTGCDPAQAVAVAGESGTGVRQEGFEVRLGE
jgi:hypothetical protein